MSDEEGRQIHIPALRVALFAVDPVRRQRLTTIVSAAGHAIVSEDEADVVLADGDRFETGGPPVVSLGARDAGQPGLLPADATAAQIDAALRATAAGLSVRGPSVPLGFHGIEEADAPLLTPREIEVLAGIGDGLSNKGVARRLGISQHTVKFHLEAVFRKLGASSRAEAVRKGLGQRLLQL